MSNNKTLFSKFARAEIDAAAGIVSGVSVITVGEARGHYKLDDKGNLAPMMVDGKTLQQVKACAEQFEGGLKIKLDHGSGAGAIVGVLKNFRIDGDKLRADMHLLETSPHRAYVLELAATMPDSVGLSIVFSGESEFANGCAYARCTELYSCDLVDEPAANPSGLLSAGQNLTPAPVLNGQALAAAPANEPNPQGELMSDTVKIPDDLVKLAGEVAEIKNELAKVREDFAAKVNAEAEKQAFAIIKKFSEQFGAPASGPSAAPSVEPTPPAAKPETFEQKVKDHYEATPKENRSKANSIKLCAQKFPALHAEYRNRVMAGEKIDL